MESAAMDGGRVRESNDEMEVKGKREEDHSG